MTSKKTHHIPNHIHLRPLPIPPAANSRHRRRTPLYLIYFITGNPGLIGYYTTFLTYLHVRLSAALAGRARIEVYARSLAGFEVAGRQHNHSHTAGGSAGQTNGSNDDSSGRGRAVSVGPRVAGKKLPLGLQGQIEDVEVRLWSQVMRREQEDEELAEMEMNGEDEDADEDEEKLGGVKVILVGHSVGAYILIELMRRAGNTMKGKAIVGGICLFPSIVDISKSRSGRTLGLLLSIYPVMLLGTLVARFIAFWIPTFLVYLLFRVLMRFPTDAAQVTAAFVKSKWGLQAATQMAHEEMHTITANRWGDDIWGAAKALGRNQSQSLRSRLFFLFAKEDHWVANETRDRLIRERGRKRESRAAEDAWKPLMEVDVKEGWTHSFCIYQSVPVAERVVEYIEELVRR